MDKMEKHKKIECKEGANPVEVFNEKFHPQHIVRGSKSFEPAVEGKDIMLKGGQETAFEWNADKGHYYTVLEDHSDWQRGQTFTPYKLLTFIAFGKHERRANTFVRHEYMKGVFPYILCGKDYFKIIKNVNRYGIEEERLKGFNRKTLKDLEGSRGLNHVLNNAVYDDFTIEPSNTDFRQVVNGKWNLYSKFPHTPVSQPVSIEDIPATWAFMTHIFGEQAEEGWKYMKLLYKRPKQILPVLVLVSEERQTGKTTFLNWLHILFGSNYGKANPGDLKSQFNSHYARKNIIGIDESVIDKRQSVEKVKSLSTAEHVSVNEKNISQYQIPFYGKIVMASNKEKDFIKIDSEEIRFWVRKVPKLSKDDKIEDLPEKLVKEVPKFLAYLEQNIDLGKKESRMWFSPKKLANNSLQDVKAESRSWLYKDLEEYIHGWFQENPTDNQLLLDVNTIKQRWFDHIADAKPHYIRKVLKEEMDMEPLTNARYSIMGENPKKPCSPYCFKRHDYVDPAEQPPHTNGTADSTDEYPF